MDTKVLHTSEIGIKEAKDSLSKLVSAVQKGEEVFLLNRGERVAKLVAVNPVPRGAKRGLGLFKDKVTLPAKWASQESREAAEKELLSTIEGC